MQEVEDGMQGVCSQHIRKTQLTLQSLRKCHKLIGFVKYGSRKSPTTPYRCESRPASPKTYPDAIYSFQTKLKTKQLFAITFTVTNLFTSKKELASIRSRTEQVQNVEGYAGGE